MKKSSCARPCHRHAARIANASQAMPAATRSHASRRSVTAPSTCALCPPAGRRRWSASPAASLISRASAAEKLPDARRVLGGVDARRRALDDEHAQPDAVLERPQLLERLAALEG